jgi:hypothetical protein
MREVTETGNMSHDDVLEVITDFPVKPLWNKVIITINTEEADGALHLGDNDFSDKQYVVSGNFTFGDQKVQPGTPVLLDIKRLMTSVKKEIDNVYNEYKVVEIDPVVVNGRMYAIVDDRVIKAIDLR